MKPIYTKEVKLRVRALKIDKTLPKISMPDEDVNKLTAVQDHWQLCPKCNGCGTYFPIPDYCHELTAMNTGPVTCNLCAGRMIISTITGQPPIL